MAKRIEKRLAPNAIDFIAKYGMKRPGLPLDGDAKLNLIVRQVRILRIAVKSKLKNARARQILRVGRAVTSGVISPRSSAMNGKLPNSLLAARKNSDPGPGTHCPCRALDSPTGTCQAAAKPRK